MVSITRCARLRRLIWTASSLTSSDSLGCGRTGAVSSWFATLHTQFSGQKHGWCGISLREDVLLDATLRWRTMIHEGLHSVSGAFSPGRPDPMSRRWEEAIVEQMQRLLRQRVLRAAGVEMDDEVFRSADNEHGYNLFIRALEAHRRRQGAEIEAFYLGLLRADAAGRAGMLVAATRALRVQRWQELL